MSTWVPMAADTDPGWNVRILDAADQQHGAGVLINGHQILTSIRVVWAALGAWREGTEPPARTRPVYAGEVRIDFTRAATRNGRWRAWVSPECWIEAPDTIPSQPNGLVVLEIAGEPPPPAQVARLGRCGVPGGRPVSIYGHPAGQSGFMINDATIDSLPGYEEWPLVRVTSEMLEKFNLGLIGSAVVDPNSGQVIGCLMDMADDQESGARWGRMVPLEFAAGRFVGLYSDLVGQAGREESVISRIRHHDDTESGLLQDHAEARDAFLSFFDNQWPTARQFGAELSRRFAHCLKIPERSYDPAYLRSFFETCLGQPGALCELSSIIGEYWGIDSHGYGPTGIPRSRILSDYPRVQHLRGLLERLDPEPLLTMRQRQKLYQIVGGISFAEAAAIHASVIEPATKPLAWDVSDSIGVVRALESANSPADGLPQVVRFVEELARRVEAGEARIGGEQTADSIRTWTDEYIADNKQLRDARDKLREKQLAIAASSPAEPPADRRALMFSIEEGNDSARYRVKATVHRAANSTWPVYEENEEFALPELPTFVDYLLGNVRQPPVYDDRADIYKPGPLPDFDMTCPLIEFAVPRPIVDIDFDNWLVGGVRPRKLGVDWPVVLRSRDRALDPSSHSDWIERWALVVGNSGLNSPHLSYWFGPPASLDDLIKAMAAIPPVGVVLDTQSVSKVNREQDAMWIALRHGMPIIVWYRDDRNSDDFVLLKAVIEAKPLLQIPDLIRWLRVCSEDDHDDRRGQNIALFYDNAQRIC